MKKKKKHMSEYQYILGDSLKKLKEFKDGKFELIITSPPYNVGKEYETKTSIEKYLAEQNSIITELVRTLSKTGSLCWQVGNFIDKGEVFPLDVFYYNIFKNVEPHPGLKLLILSLSNY